MNRRDAITVGEYYHVFNRGVERRQIFHTPHDYARFLDALFYFNTWKPAWLVNDLKQADDGYRPDPEERLVELVAYCLNPNHFHLLLKENKAGGIASFMKKVGTGYAMYYNKKNTRTGVLFQGRFKSVHVGSNDILLYVSAYVNCNSQVHGGEDAAAYRWCSFSEYLTNTSAKVEDGPLLSGVNDGICQKDVILGQFDDPERYRIFCLEKAVGMRERKEMESFHLE